MVPVSVLPAAGLLVALGRMIHKMSEDAAGTVTNVGVHAVGEVFYSGGLSIFEQLPVIFAVGVAIGFTGGAGIAGLAAVVGYFTLASVLKVIGTVRGLEMAINTGVFGGIIIGLMTASLYKRFYQTRLNPILGFFAGKRLVPIVTAAASIFLGILLGFIWPPIQTGINHFGTWSMNSEFGPAFFAAVKRALIPVGLHHVYYPPFLYQFGEFVASNGKVVHGETARYFAGDPTAGKFMGAEFAFMLYGLPAAAFAIYLRAKKEKRKAVGGMMLAAALTAIITGISEPIEFAFIFVAPVLYIFHILAAFVSGWLTSALDVHMGYTFSASLIDCFLGFFNAKNSSRLFLIVGPITALVYFSAFYFAIGLLDLKTPGREDTTDDAEGGPVSTSDKAKEVLKALGGAMNIVNLDACITRLRLSVKNAGSVDIARLKALGAAGVMNAGGGNLQVVFGTESDLLKEEIKAVMARGDVAPAGSQLKSPLKGKIIALSAVPDETFSQGILGEGVAIDPSEGLVTAPCDATVAQVFRTQHAIGLVSKDGAEILIHVGIDTVKMNGRGFEALVKQGDQVKTGQKLLKFDLELVRKEAKSTITPVVITNTADFKSVKVSAKSGTVSGSDTLITIEKA